MYRIDLPTSPPILSCAHLSTSILIQVVENVEKILAIELLAAVHALHHRRKKSSTFQIPQHLQKMFDECGVISPPMLKDRYLKSDFEDLLSYMREVLPSRRELVSPQGDINNDIGTN